MCVKHAEMLLKHFKIKCSVLYSLSFLPFARYMVLGCPVTPVEWSLQEKHWGLLMDSNVKSSWFLATSAVNVFLIRHETF